MLKMLLMRSTANKLLTILYKLLCCQGMLQWWCVLSMHYTRRILIIWWYWLMKVIIMINETSITTFNNNDNDSNDNDYDNDNKRFTAGSISSEHAYLLKINYADPWFYFQCCINQLDYKSFLVSHVTQCLQLGEMYPWLVEWFCYIYIYI